jgi:transposase-like protein
MGSGANGGRRAYLLDTKSDIGRVSAMLSVDDLFQGRHFDREINTLCVRWYLRYKLSFRDLVEMMAERGLSLAHTTIMRWVQRYILEFEKRWNHFARQAGGSWRVDETYVKIKGRWVYLYRAVDKAGKTVDFLVCAKRDVAAAKAFFRRAFASHGRLPRKITLDGYQASHRAARELLAQRRGGARTRIRSSKYLNNLIEQDHRGSVANFLSRVGWGYDRRAWGRRNSAMIDFKGSHFERDVILWGVRWYVAYPMSYRQLEEMMEERGVEADRSTLNRRVVKYAPLLEKQFRARKRAIGSSWRLDETYVKVKGRWKYLYRAVDKAGATVDFLLTAKRDRKAALRSLPKAIGQHGKPEKITIAKSGANTAAIESYNAEHEADIEIRRIKYLNNIVEQDHRAVKRVTRPMLGFKSFRAASATLSGIELMHMIRKGQSRVSGKLRPAQQFYALAA